MCSEDDELEEENILKTFLWEQRKGEVKDRYIIDKKTVSQYTGIFLRTQRLSNYDCLYKVYCVYCVPAKSVAGEPNPRGESFTTENEFFTHQLILLDTSEGAWNVKRRRRPVEVDTRGFFRR